jgi:hypothetical protein
MHRRKSYDRENGNEGRSSYEQRGGNGERSGSSGN